MKAITMLKKVGYGFLINLNLYKQHIINIYLSCVFMKKIYAIKRSWKTLVNEFEVSRANYRALFKERREGEIF